MFVFFFISRCDGVSELLLFGKAFGSRCERPTMPLARLRIDLPEHTWIDTVSSTFPEATFKVLAVLPDDDTGIALVEITATELEAVIESMAKSTQLLDMEPIQRESDRLIVRLESEAPLLLQSARRAGIPIEPPIVIQNGEATGEFRASNDRLGALADDLQQSGLPFTVEAVYDAPSSESFLSETERELLVTAVECGYYETPRDCTLTGLAERVGIAKSTCSETLRRAESAVIKRFVDRELDSIGS